MSLGLSGRQQHRLIVDVAGIRDLLFCLDNHGSCKGLEGLDGTCVRGVEAGTEHVVRAKQCPCTYCCLPRFSENSPLYGYSGFCLWHRVYALEVDDFKS